MLLKHLKSLFNSYPIFPVFAHHLLYSLCNHLGALWTKSQLDIFSTSIPLKLVIARKGHFLVIKEPHCDSNRPNISRFARISIRTCKLMLRSSKSRSTSWKVRNIIIALESNSSKINNNDLITHFLSFSTQNIVHFNISVRNVIIMHILNPMTQFNKNYSHYISKTACFVLTTHVLYDFLVSIVAFIQFTPIHQLSQTSQLVYCADLVVSMNYLQTLTYVVML